MTKRVLITAGAAGIVAKLRGRSPHRVRRFSFATLTPKVLRIWNRRLVLSS